MEKKKIKERITFTANKTNILLHEVYRAYKTAGNMMRPISGYGDYSEVWQYQNLERQRYIIKATDKRGKYFWKLTTKGMNFGELLSFKLSKDRKWDGRWRILIFDIPEDYKRSRDFLRRRLKELNFYKLQNSVWVSAYPIPKSFSLFLNKYKLGKYIRYIVSEDINNDKDIKDFFDL